MGLFDNLFKAKPDAADEAVVEAAKRIAETEKARLVEASKTAAPVPTARPGIVPTAKPGSVPAPRAYSPRSLGQVVTPGRPPAPAPGAEPKSGATRRIKLSGASETTAKPGEIVLLLEDVLPRIPSDLVADGRHDLKRELRFKVEDLSADIARGRAAVSLRLIAAQVPDILREPVAEDDTRQVRLPLQKLVEQIGFLPVKTARPTAPAPLASPAAPPVLEPPPKPAAETPVLPPPPGPGPALPVSEAVPSAETAAVALTTRISLDLATVLRGCPCELLVAELPPLTGSERITFPWAPIEKQLASGKIEVSSVRFIFALPAALQGYFEAREGVRVPLPLDEVRRNLPADFREPLVEVLAGGAAPISPAPPTPSIPNAAAVSAPVKFPEPLSEADIPEVVFIRRKPAAASVAAPEQPPVLPEPPPIAPEPPVLPPPSAVPDAVEIPDVIFSRAPRPLAEVPPPLPVEEPPLFEVPISAPAADAPVAFEALIPSAPAEPESASAEVIPDELAPAVAPPTLEVPETPAAVIFESTPAAEPAMEAAPVEVLPVEGSAEAAPIAEPLLPEALAETVVDVPAEPLAEASSPLAFEEKAPEPAAEPSIALAPTAPVPETEAGREEETLPLVEPEPAPGPAVEIPPLPFIAPAAPPIVMTPVVPVVSVPEPAAPAPAEAAAESEPEPAVAASAAESAEATPEPPPLALAPPPIFVPPPLRQSGASLAPEAPAPALDPAAGAEPPPVPPNPWMQPPPEIVARTAAMEAETPPPPPSPILPVRIVSPPVLRPFVAPPPLFGSGAEELPPPAAVAPPEPVAPPPPPPPPPLDLTRARAAFALGEDATLAAIGSVLTRLPGISGCFLAVRHEEARTGDLPEDFSGEAVREFAERFSGVFDGAAEKLGVGEVQHLTLFAKDSCVSFFAQGSALVCAVHRTRSFLPGVREKLAAAVESLAGA